MKFNETTHIISICVLLLTAVYTLVYSGVSGILLCAAVAFIAAAFISEIELVVAVTILFVLCYTMILKQFLRRFEGFDNTPKDITNRLREERTNYERMTEPAITGVHNSFIEGFANATAELGTDAQKDSDASTPAPVVTGNQIATKEVEEVTAAIADHKKVESEEFQSATNELFKLGKMPSEHKEGPLLDAGGTLLKAMGSFDPDTTKKMTQDTKQLLETQKSLMSMLTQMRPILADGKELLQTFGGMFGQGNAGPFKLGQ
jgi:hypothetical protein